MAVVEYYHKTEGSALAAMGSLFIALLQSYRGSLIQGFRGVGKGDKGDMSPRKLPC